MPSYELALVLRVMSKPEVAATLKRSAQEIFDRGGFLRRIDNLGTRDTPYKISADGQPHRKASYFSIRFDAPQPALRDLYDIYQRDVDILRKRIYKVEDPPTQECTLHEEILPPAYRKEVREMVAIGKRKEARRKKYSLNIGLEKTPFQT